MENVATKRVLLLSQMESWKFTCTHNRKKWINITIRNKYLRCTEHQTLLFGTPWRYLYILFIAVSCDALVFRVNRLNWLKAKETSGIVFDYRYKTISTKDEHELEKISHKLRNILICPKRWPRLGRLRKNHYYDPLL